MIAEAHRAARARRLNPQSHLSRIAVGSREYVNIYDFRTVLRHGRVARDRGTSRGRSERRNLTVILNLILTEAYTLILYRARLYEHNRMTNPMMIRQPTSAHI